MPDTHPPQPHLDALIIGAGFAGMYQLIQLRDRLGLTTRLLEAASGVGGTWFWNRYPGARCDSESHSYCYGFSKELLEEWEWSERYPEQPEILRYLNHVADRFDLRRSISFNTPVTACTYNETENRWHVSTATGQSFTCHWLITAVGCLSSANVPAIPGLESFKGAWYHTGQWPHEGVDFTGKTVAQIGTGSTGIQAAPVIASQAAHLTIFQRTANYSVPAHNAPLSRDFKDWVKQNHPEIRAVMKSTPNGHPFVIAERKVADVSPDEREALYEAAWAKGGLQFRATFQDLLVDKAANNTAADFLKRKIRDIVKNPETAAVLSDIDHPYAAKRPPIDTHYFDTFNRANVDLVDLRKAPIERITETGIKTADTEYQADIIVFATGFDAMTGPLFRLNLTGRDGLRLQDAWSAGPETWLGLAVPGFPNLFTITGPGSPSVLCNMPVCIEQHVDWITACIQHARANAIATIETTPEAATEWSDKVDAAARATLLPEAGHSWYLGANVPGKPRRFMPYAGGMAHYRDICDAVTARGYEGLVMSPAPAHAP